MSCILYYSKYCEVSKKYLQVLSKFSFQKEIHFICIDKRIKEANNKTYIILEDNQKIILPESVTRVPALLLLNKGFEVLYGEEILNFIKQKEEVHVKKATQNNIEPLAYSFGGSKSDIVSDSYTYFDQLPEDLEAKGNGGIRQMHNYMDLNSSFNSQEMLQENNNDTSEEKSNQIIDERIKKMKQEREADLQFKFNH